jgi:hypothetical protein
VGGVTGRYAQGGERIMSAYVDLEAVIRTGQASRSVVSASGSIMAIRRVLWRELPPGLICDDLFTGLSVVMQGRRMGFCPDAVAVETRTLTKKQQYARRARTLTGVIQYCFLVPAALVPWRNPVWGHFILHKVLRLVAPIALLMGVGVIAAYGVVRTPRVLASAIAVVAMLAVGARLADRRRFDGTVKQVWWLTRLLFVPIVAVANGLRGRWSVWSPVNPVPAGPRPEVSVQDAGQGTVASLPLEPD